MSSILIFFLILAGVFLIFMVMRKSKLRHKLAFLFLLVLILFGYFSFTSAFDGQKMDLTDFKGVSHTIEIYFSWLGAEFGNAQAITSRAVENDSRINSQR